MLQSILKMQSIKKHWHEAIWNNVFCPWWAICPSKVNHKNFTVILLHLHVVFNFQFLVFYHSLESRHLFLFTFTFLIQLLSHRDVGQWEWNILPNNTTMHLKPNAPLTSSQVVHVNSSLHSLSTAYKLRRTSNLFFTCLSITGMDTACSSLNGHVSL